MKFPPLFKGDIVRSCHMKQTPYFFWHHPMLEEDLQVVPVGEPSSENHGKLIGGVAPLETSGIFPEWKVRRPYDGKSPYELFFMVWVGQFWGLAINETMKIEMENGWDLGSWNAGTRCGWFVIYFSNDNKRSERWLYLRSNSVCPDSHKRLGTVDAHPPGKETHKEPETWFSQIFMDKNESDNHLLAEKSMIWRIPNVTVPKWWSLSDWCDWW